MNIMSKNIILQEESENEDKRSWRTAQSFRFEAILEMTLEEGPEKDFKLNIANNEAKSAYLLSWTN